MNPYKWSLLKIAQLMDLPRKFSELKKGVTEEIRVNYEEVKKPNFPKKKGIAPEITIKSGMNLFPKYYDEHERPFGWRDLGKVPAYFSHSACGTVVHRGLVENDGNSFTFCPLCRCVTDTVPDNLKEKNKK